MGLYIYMKVLKILLFFYFIDLCHILYRPKLRPVKFYKKLPSTTYNMSTINNGYYNQRSWIFLKKIS